MVNFTMLVCSRPRLTKQALKSLNGMLKKDITVTVYEDRKSNDETVEIMAHFWDSNPDNVYLCGSTSDYGTGKLRNNVIVASEKYFGRGDYLYLSDNDVFFLPNWLPTLIDCYESAWSSGCRVIGGVGHPYHQQGDTLGVCSFNVRYAVHEVLAQPLQSMLMRWEVWDQYGPFCETPVGKVCQGEDIDFTNRIRADGFKLGVVNPPLLVNTGITNSFGEKIPGWELVKAQCPKGVICE